MLCALMTDMEYAAWQSFDLVIQNFLGNRKAENYQELVENMLSKFKDLGVKMSIKVYFLFSHSDCFLANLGKLNEERRERFHQNNKVMEERYQGRWDAHMMVDYCCNLQSDCLAASHSTESYKRKFVNIE